MYWIVSEKLWVLQNTVVLCHDALPWKFSMSALMRKLAERSLLRIAQNAFKE